jgi:glucose uptake protein
VILPSTYSGALLCLALSLLCWGSWANLQKLSGKRRYELFYWDFSIGIALTAIVAAFTLGSLRPSELTFQDNLLITSYHKISYALEAGALFNLGILLLVGALSVAPMAVVFPIAMGVGLVVGVGWLLFPPQGSALLLLGGAVLVLIAIVLNAVAYSSHALELQKTVKKPLMPEPRNPAAAAAARQALPATGIALSVVSGFVLGMIPPLSDLSRSGEDGLGAYSAAFLIAIAMLVTTFVYAPFFITFPVQGAPVQFRAYFKGGTAGHLYGFVAGVLWCGGLIATFASGGALATIQAGPVAGRGFAEGAAVLAALWGLLAWREFRGSSPRVLALMISMLILWIVGAGMVALAPALAK